jgi:Asp/Glu/hydantoin racemase
MAGIFKRQNGASRLMPAMTEFSFMPNARPRIRVVNPNSNEAVTRGIDEAVQPLRFDGGPEIVCSTLAEGPFGVETQEHVESVALPLRRLVEADNASDAFVIACYSDPGLHVCREGTTRPVFGIAECGVLTALARAERFGVIAIMQRSIARHMRYLRQMGLMDRLAGERPLNMSVAEIAGGDGTLSRMIEVGRALKDQDGANAIVMGCAGMARHRKPLEDALGIPVIDPTQAAVTMALGVVQLGR